MCRVFGVKIGVRLAFAALFLFAAGGLYSQAVPGWVTDLGKAFPSADWVAVSGSGANRGMAESAAMGALAQAFKTDVASLTQASTQMAKIVTDTAGKKNIAYSESKNIAQEVNAASNVRGLIGVQTDSYQAKDGTWHVNARMNRRECAARYSGMIKENERVIGQLTRLAAGLPASFDAYAALNYACNLAVPTDNFQSILEVLDTRMVSQKPSYGSADALKVQLQNAARGIIIKVTVTGDTEDRISRAFTQFFSGRAFRTTRSGTPNYLFEASLDFKTADFGANQRYPAIRYTMNVYAEDKDGIEVFSYAGGGRASHVTESEARQLALRKIEASIGDAAEEDSFARAFDAYLNSLLK
jgi:hypothetical protein